MVYKLETYTLTVPLVDNDGNARVDFLTFARDEMMAAGLSGWTETPSVGFWHGRRERGTLITVYADRDAWRPLQTAANRLAMYAGQDAVQLTRGPKVEVYEGHYAGAHRAAA